MVHKGDRQPAAIEGDLNDPRSLGHLSRIYLEDLAVKNFSKFTIRQHRVRINRFIRWSAEREVHRGIAVSRPLIERYQKHLFYFRNEKNKPLSFRSQHSLLTSLRCWMKWLTKHRHLLYNPASELELPKLGTHLPPDILRPDEAEVLLNEADVTTPLGLRDRAMMETLYSTGMRRLELAHLQVYDIDFIRRTVMIRQGKGKKDRVVPIGERACCWVEVYLNEVRPQWHVGNHNTLFISKDGLPFHPDRLSTLVSGYVKRSPLPRQGGCHLFRHSMATAMLENGADIRYIQAMLGHSRLETTEVYTRVGIKKLQEIHTATHPAKPIDNESSESAESKNASPSSRAS